MENFLLEKWNLTENEFAKMLRRAIKMNFLPGLNLAQVNAITHLARSSNGKEQLDADLAQYLDKRLTPYYNNTKDLKMFSEIALDKGLMLKDLQEFANTLGSREQYKWKRANPFLETGFGVPREEELEFLTGFLEWYLLTHGTEESKEFEIIERKNNSFKLIAKNGRGGVVDLHPFDLVNLPRKQHGIIVGFYNNYEVKPHQSKCIVAFNNTKKLILLDEVNEKNLYRKWNWQKTAPVKIEAGDKRVFFDIPITSEPGSDHDRQVYGNGQYQLVTSNEPAKKLKSILQYILFDLSRKFESYPIKVHGFSKVTTSEAPNAPKFIMKISLPVTTIRSVDEVNKDFRENVKKQNIPWEKVESNSIIETLQLLVYPKGSAVKDIRSTTNLLCSLVSTKVAKMIYVDEYIDAEASSLVQNQAFPTSFDQMLSEFREGCDTVVEAAELAKDADPKSVKDKFGKSTKTIKSVGNKAKKVSDEVLKGDTKSKEESNEESKGDSKSKVSRSLNSVSETINNMYNNLNIGDMIDRSKAFDGVALLKTLNDDSTLKADVCEGNTLHPALSEDIFAHIGKVLVQQVMLGSMVNNNRPNQGQEIIKRLIETPE